MGFIFIAIKNNSIETIDADAVANQLMTNPIMSIAPVLMGFLPVIYFMKKNVKKEHVLQENRKFSIKIILMWFVVLLGVGYLGSLISGLMESILNVFGFTLDKSEKMLETFNAPWMILYVGAVAPIVEELIYRGMVLRFLDKFDKGVAIVGSAVLFGLMHGNFCQIFFAIGIGILLGYVTEEYSIKLAIILHMVHNIFSCLLSKTAEFLSAYNVSEEIIIGVVLIFSILCVLVIFIRNFKNIRTAFNLYKPEKQMCLYLFTSFSVVVLMAFNLIEAFCLIARV